jgi:DNA adenine methylase
MQLHNQTILRRQGNKGKLLPWLLPCFPAQITSLIEPFAGTLAVALAMLRSHRCSYCFCNDQDQEVVNLWYVLREAKPELLDALLATPYHEQIFAQFRKTLPTDPVWRAARYLYLSNFSYLGDGTTLRFGQTHDRRRLLAALDAFQAETLSAVQFLCGDFRAVFSKLALRPGRERAQAFVYNDPPYVGTQSSYTGFTLQDLQDLLELNLASGLRFALSEFASAPVLALLADYPVSIYRFPERRVLSTRAQEILVYAGYELSPPQLALFAEDIQKPPPPQHLTASPLACATKTQNE